MNAFVKKIDLALAEKLRKDLINQGFELSSPPHTIFSAKKKGTSCTLYCSGKLMVQGKDKANFITFYLEPEILKDLSFSYPQSLINPEPRIGIDEAGKGDYFGPLCIAGVYASEEGLQKLTDLKVRDSKTIGDKAIIRMASQIRSSLPHALVKLFPNRYNELYSKFDNLNRLLGWGHATAIEELASQTGCHKAIIDQFASEHIVENALRKKGLQINLTQRHRGEEDLVVAAASILARAAFVEGIETLSKMVEFSLPKGANSHVIIAGKKILAKYGEQMLAKVGKLHFKTTSQIHDA